MRNVGRNLLAAASASVLAACAGLPAWAAPARYDTILRHGTIFDGSGAPRFEADIGIRDGRIARIGDLSKDSAKTELDMSGLFVAPGFINLHDHATAEGVVHAENMLTQGVTTELLNPDGYGPMDVPGQLATFGASGLATNIGGYIGFNSVWEEVMGTTDHRPTAEETARMRGLISKALTDGVWGVSAGLDYKPGYFARTDEVIAVVDVARDWRTNFPNHDRLAPETGYSSSLGVAETIRIGEAAGLAPEITHMKAQGHEQGKGPDILAMMSASTARGHYAASDVYPYLAGESGLDALMVPGWALEGGREKMLERFRDPATRMRIVAEVEKAMNARFGGPKGVYLPDTQEELTDIMRKLGVGPGEAVLKTLEKSERMAILRFGVESDLVAFLQYPATSIACDCGALDGQHHPRVYGTFPRVLGRYVREQKALTWEDALRKMSGLPASTIGLVDRGFLAPGMAADITAFDPQTVIDRATFDKPALPSEGIRFVLVNGALALRDGKPTGQQGGRALRRSEHMPTRPMSTGPAKVAAEAEMVSAEAGSEGSLHASFALSQGAGAHQASGRFRVTGKAGKPVLEATELGMLQTATGWASFTAQVRLASGAEEAVTVILDKADPMSHGAAIVTVDGEHVHLKGQLAPAGLSIDRPG